MARTLPFNRSPQATRARLAKLSLIPLPKREADLLSLHAHCALQALIDARGWLAGVQSLTEMLILTSFVAEAGYGQIARATWLDAEAALNSAFCKGRDAGCWRVDADGSISIAAVLAMHDVQLYSAPFGVPANASARLERLKTGEPEPLPQRKRA